MNNMNAEFGKHSPDQDSSVAMHGILFPTKEDHAELLDAIQETCNSILKLGGFGQFCVEDASVSIIEPGSCGSPSHLRSQEQILEAGRLH